MLQAYEKTNILREFCIVKSFTNETSEFFQIAKRTGLPKNFFVETGNNDNSMIASDFVRAIVIGERDFVLDKIIKSELTPNIIIEKFEDLFFDIVGQMECPTDIFIPLEPYYKSFYKFIYSSKLKVDFSPGKDACVTVGNRRIQIHWITSSNPIKDIIAINKIELNISQKVVSNSKGPNGIEPISEFNFNSPSDRLMLYFAEKDAETFDFVFRSVISVPALNNKSALIVNIRDNIAQKE